MSLQNKKFIPARITSDMLGDDLLLSPGTLYFVTDTGEMYLDVSEDERIQVGGRGVAVLYGNDPEPEGNALSGEFTLNFSEKCQENDLILNTDGCFYRVLEIDSDLGQVVCQQLAVSGSGSGGGGGGGSSDTTYKEKMSMKISGIQQGASYVEGQDAFATIIAYSAIDQDDTILDTDLSVVCSIINGSTNKTLYTTTLSVKHGVPTQWNFGQHLQSGVKHTVKFQAQGLTTQQILSPATSYKNIGLTNLTITLANDFNKLEPLDANNITIPFIINGTIAKKLIYYVDGNRIADETLGAAVSGRHQYQFPNTLAAGNHTIKIALTSADNEDIAAAPLVLSIGVTSYLNVNNILWFGDYDSSYYDYDFIQIPFMVTGINNTVEIYHNNILVGTLAELSENTEDWYYYTITNFDASKAGIDNRYEFVCNGEYSAAIILTIIESDLQLVQDKLQVNFTPLGRSNSEIADIRKTWSYDYNGQTYNASFSGFNWYTNGWMLDEENTPILRLTNGAKFSIPIKKDNSLYSLNNMTFEFKLKIRNILEYKKNISVSSTSDDIAEAEDDSLSYAYDNENGVCVSYYGNGGVGIIIGTQQAFMKALASGTHVSAPYLDEEIIHLSFTIGPLANDSQKRYIMSVYLNGLYTGCKLLNSPPSTNVSEVTFLSEDCDLDIYSFRLYNTSLDFVSICNNYAVDKKSPEIWAQNQIIELQSDGSYDISVERMEEYNASAIERGWEPIMPYFVTEVDGTLPTKYNEDDPDRYDTSDKNMPAKKGDNKLVRFEFHNTPLDLAYNSSQMEAIQTEYGETGYDPKTYYFCHCPSFILLYGDLNVQGTSSQIYPRKNYKLKGNRKAKKYPLTHSVWLVNGGPHLKEVADQNKIDINDVPEESKPNFDDVKSESGEKFASGYHMDNYFNGTKKFTFKVDYMESSGSYNTGFANLIGGLGLQHPLKYIIPSLSTTGLRTTVYGFPCLGFEKKNNKTTFIGRYNFNLDKSSNEYYGFELEDSTPNIEGSPAIADIAECWEFKNNQGDLCSFKALEGVDDPFSTPGTGTADDPGQPVAWDHFEYRYIGGEDPVSGENNADVIDALLEDRQLEDGTYSNVEDRLNYFKGRLNNFEKVWRWINSTDTSVVPSEAERAAGASARALPSTYTSYDGKTYSYDTKEYRNAKFRTEFDQHLNLDYCLTYFVLTELCLCFDSRGKNMMFATYGPKELGGEYIWFPIFYDIDTQLGLNNSGALLWDYPEDATLNGTYSTPNSVLWTNLYNNYFADLADKYQELRSGSALKSADSIESWYSCKPELTHSPAMRGARPLVALNLDQYVKYIDIITNEYISAPGVTATDSKGEYLRDLQGDRSLSRKLLLRNRLYYEDSWWQKGDFISSSMNADTTADLRLGLNRGVKSGTNDLSETSDIWYEENGVIVNTRDNNKPYSSFTDGEKADYEALNTPDHLTITPFLTCWLSAGPDGVQGSKVRAQAGQPTNIPVVIDTNKLISTDQIYYIRGMGYLASINNLYQFYPRKASLSAGRRQREIFLGSDYARDGGQSFKNKQNLDSVSLSESSILETIDVTNFMNGYTEMDLRFTQKLKTVRALGSGIQSIQFAPGSALSTCYLPGSITELELIEQDNLTNIITDASDVANRKPGLYIKNLTDNAENGYEPKLSAYTVINGKLGTHSYALLRNILARRGSKTEPVLTLNLQGMIWSPYKLVEYGSTYNNSLTYVYDNYHNQLLNYSYNADTWEDYTLNERLYYIDPDDSNNYVTGSKIATLDVLKTLANAGNELSFVGGKAEGLTGTCYIENTTINIISETDAYAIEQVFPKMKIFGKNVNTQYQARFVRTDSTGKKTILGVQKANDEKGLSKPYDSNGNSIYDVEMPHYDFTGWKINGTTYTNSSNWSNIFTSGTQDYEFEAVYTVHNYTVAYFNYDGTPHETFEIPYGEKIKLPTTMPVKDSGDLETTYVYGLQGYTEGGILISGLEDTTVARNYSLTASFVQRNINDLTEEEYNKLIPVDEYFTLTSITYQESRTDNTPWHDSSYNISGYEIAAKDVSKLPKKVLIPTQVNGVPVVSIANSGFANNQTFTHLLFHPSNKLRSIQESAFEYNADYDHTTTLKYVSFENLKALRQIKAKAFRRSALDPVTFHLEYCTVLGEIQIQAFQHSLTEYSSGERLIIIPGSVYAIGGKAFANLNYLNKPQVTFQIGTANNKSVLDLSYTAWSPDGGSDYFNIFFQGQTDYFKLLTWYSTRYTTFDNNIEMRSNGDIVNMDSLFTYNFRTYELL